jgi:hypothetical protein
VRRAPRKKEKVKAKIIHRRTAIEPKIGEAT